MLSVPEGCQRIDIHECNGNHAQSHDYNLLTSVGISVDGPLGRRRVDSIDDFNAMVRTGNDGLTVAGTLQQWHDDGEVRYWKFAEPKATGARPPATFAL